MRPSVGIILIATMLTACEVQPKVEAPIPSPVQIVGTWELISATATQKDSTFSTFNPQHKMIKIINPTHFAFFSHDMSAGKDTTTAAYSAGGGTYTIADSIYTEHLEYFNLREWEGHTFTFTVTIRNDTLTQQGLEKLEDLGIDRVIVEKYKKAAK